MTAVHATPLVAGLDAGSVAAMRDALARQTPIGLVHDRLPPDEQAALVQRLAAHRVPADTAAVVFTSGSTGRPKGVVLSHAAARAAVAMNAARLGVVPGDRWLLALPPAHVAGLGVILRATLGGLALSLASGRLADALAAERPTLVSLVPTQLATLLDDPAFVAPRELRAILLGGAAAAPELVARAHARGLPVLTTYGMSETFGQVATAPPGVTAPPGAIGTPLHGVTVLAGTRAAPDLVRVVTPAAFTGYLDEPRPDGDAVVTADLGFVEDGWLHVIGRADDIIITGGEKVHPLAVEHALAAVAGVAASCVVGVPDPRWGQRVVAAVVVAAGFDRAGLDAAIAALAPHARPREVVFLDALPLLPSGKPARRALAAQLAAGGLSAGS